LSLERLLSVAATTDAAYGMPSVKMPLAMTSLLGPLVVNVSISRPEPYVALWAAAGRTSHAVAERAAVATQAAIGR
jgi:hypothetical protein